MAWLYLVLAGWMEVGWALGLKLGWTARGEIRPWPLVGAAVGMIASGALLMLAQRTIPLGTAYAVWTGIGAVGTFVAGVALFHEPAQWGRVACVALIACGIVGLKVLSPS
ncbi:MAG: multidrug efflux SMR transporter [Polyangiales bacterium]